MEDVLLSKVINGEIPLNRFRNWLLHAEPESHGDFKDIVDTKVSQLNFITFFLNFVHGQAPGVSAISTTPQKLQRPKITKGNLISESPQCNKSFKNALFATPNAHKKENANASWKTDYHNGSKASTPKYNNNTPNRNSNFSPISPLYNNSSLNNISGNESTHQAYKAVSAPNRYSFSLEDFLTTSTKNSSKKKKKSEVSGNSKTEASRRIKPTSIGFREDSQNAFQKTGNSFNFQDNSEELSVQTATELRTVLTKEKANISFQKDSFETNCRSILLKRNCSPSKTDTPTLELVTFKQHIDYVIDIYKTILDHQLTLNITSEIYFLISLFLIKQNDQSKLCDANIPLRVSKGKKDVSELDDSSLGVDILDSKETSFKYLVSPNRSTAKKSISKSDIFHSIHNVVYFAVKALETQIGVIRFYDKTTIRLLAENDRVKEFASDFSKRLMKHVEENIEKLCIESIPLDLQTNVYFNIDTDHQKNFPDQTSFHAFRKQRDLFYEILRIWETNHLVDDWNFSNGLAGKIKTLFALNHGSANLMHLSRLFKNQLLSSCAKGAKEKGLSENGLSVISSLRIDADKLSRLTDRLVTKEATNGINTLPRFSGYQEFFKEFIVVSANYNFSKHLSDCLIVEIVELNDTTFSDVGLDEEGNDVNLDASKLYANCIRNLRILAKFLGYLESLPYRSDTHKLPSSLVEAQIEIRKQIRPALDVKFLLQSSIEHGSVVFIIPWLTKYLAMLDYVTLRLPYYSSLYLLLFDLYQNYQTSQTPHYNIAVVKFCLGWLFEMPHFPEIEYIKFCGSSLRKNRSELNMKNTKNSLSSQEKCLDSIGIINRSLLYLCCPYLDEIRKILSNNAPGSKIAVKYITPVTAVESHSEAANKKLEQQLEDAFFNGQPASLRKTIEFVSERVASTAVKFICQDLVPTAKAKAMTELKEYLNKIDAGEEALIGNTEKKKVLQAKLTPFAQTHLDNFLQSCYEEMQRISEDKISVSIDGLLSADTLVETKHVCVTIAKKWYTGRVKQWLAGHVNLAMFTKEFDSEIKKRILNGKRSDKEKTAFLLPPGGRDSAHNENTISGFHTLNNIREACCQVIENFDVTAEFVLEVVQSTRKSLSQRNDLNDIIIVTISVTLFDFCVLLVARYPSIFVNSELMNEFVQIWVLHSKSVTSFKTFFSPRNVQILQSSRSTQQSWTLYAKLVSSLLNNRLIELEDLESQCTGFYNKNWDPEILSSYSHFLRKLVHFSNGEGKETFVYLLDFLSEFCSDL